MAQKIRQKIAEILVKIWFTITIFAPKSAMMSRFLVSMCLVIAAFSASAQNAAIKTNLLYDATSTLNLGVEVGLSSRWSADVSVNYNPWTFKDNMKWKHWQVQPELRYWPCQAFNGFFLATHVQGGVFNFGNIDFGDFKDYRYEGWFLGAGVGAGYQWILSRRLNLEVEGGGGFNYSRYDKYLCPVCGTILNEDMPARYVGITKLTIALLYLF